MRAETLIVADEIETFDEWLEAALERAIYTILFFVVIDVRGRHAW